MSEKRISELRKRALTSELANMHDTDRRAVLAMLVAQLSYDEIEQLCVIPYRELNSRGATRVGHRPDRRERPKGLATKPKNRRSSSLPNTKMVGY